MKKVFFSFIVFSFFVVFGFNSVSAEEIDSSKDSYLDERGQQVLEDYKKGKIESNNRGSGSIQLFSSGKRVTFKRGSWAAWSEGIVDWTYSGSRIYNSDGDQDSGYVFPNLVREKGISKLSTSSSFTHRYRHKTSIAIGSPTPWGDVKFSEQGFTDYINVYGDGDYYINKDD